MPIGWNVALNDLIVLLAGLYPDREKTRFVVRRSGLDPDEIDFAGTPKVFWMRIIEEINRRDMVQSLIKVGKGDFPNVNFDTLEQQLKQPALRTERELKDNEWKGAIAGANNLEKIIGAQPTFLPISFLEIGLLRAKSVARVESPLGFGTGFLTHNNILITNNHVISSPADAQKTKIWLNYQRTMVGADTQVAEFTLDPEVAFATSPLDGGNDWTAVRVRGNPNLQWGALELGKATVGVNNFVNIIQHPGGLPKQIALYHNVVAFADDSRVQYLTDTMPGSSGSPVFDSKWNVVALHHSGGWLPEPGTNKVFFRNEGIHVRALVKGLKEHGVLDA
ncbi:MAG: trypsin-like peptidase domain-containing protein [Chloroflexi bacterium]|nr:trypsin-like peptidase domain-containing protein [Chloroflexota bacterium]